MWKYLEVSERFPIFAVEIKSFYDGVLLYAHVYMDSSLPDDKEAQNIMEVQRKDSRGIERDLKEIAENAQRDFEKWERLKAEADAEAEAERLKAQR